MARRSFSPGRGDYDDVVVILSSDDDEDEDEDKDTGFYDEEFFADQCQQEHDRLPAWADSRLKINHKTGVGRMKAEDFIEMTLAPGFDAVQAFDMLQKRLTMDYGRKSSGSRPASEADAYYPTFHLDMISIIGCPLRPISRKSGFFDNITFTFRDWKVPYSIKHVRNNLPFHVLNRTFHLGVAASRDRWFIVMHPTATEMEELPGSRAKRHQANDASMRTAMQRQHAEVLASYIKEVFLEGELLGEGVEPSWRLGDHRSTSITLAKWTEFQTIFVRGWEGFAKSHSYDEYWTRHRPSFHAYDYGANIEIEVTEALQSMPQEMPRQMSEEESDSNDSEDGDDSDGNSVDAFVEKAIGSEDEPLSSRMSSPHDEADDVESDLFASTDPDIGETNELDLFTGGLRQLRDDLEQKYNLENILQVAYAVATDINCVEMGTTEEAGEVVCLLGDSLAVGQAFSSVRDVTFYPMAFHPKYGNFSSRRPPRFLEPVCSILMENMSMANQRNSVLSFGYFQGYSNIKRSIRSRQADLLAAKGIATAALTLPLSEANRSSATVRKKQAELLRTLRGELTPDDPESSVPFARERKRVETALEEGQYAFRMEQVVTVRASKLVAARRSFTTVLKPIFQIMLFFLREQEKYIGVLRKFRPSVFPKILCSFARIFELAAAEMSRRYESQGRCELDLAESEAVALLDRLGNYCFTGDPRVLPRTVLSKLETLAIYSAAILLQSLVVKPLGGSHFGADSVGASSLARLSWG